MTIEHVLGQPAVFAPVDQAALPEGLTPREARVLVGALNFHALLAPARELTVHLYMDDRDALPRTTDDATFTGLSREFRHRRATFAIRSLVPDEGRPGPASPAAALIARPSRHLYITRDAVLAHDPRRDDSRRLRHRLSRFLKARVPLAYNQLRDLELLRHRGSVVSPAPRRDYAAEFAPGGRHEDAVLQPAVERAGSTRAVLFGLHWFELGGAERWAFESVRIARDAGFLPVVLSNRDSQQPWIGRPELDGALVIPFSEPTVASQTPGTEELLRAILRTFEVRGVMVHHNQWLYDRLHWIALSRPGIPIIDSTHIVEKRGGGFPRSSAMVASAITQHHVISPALARWMTQVQGIPSDRVVMAPLTGLTVADHDAVARRRDPAEPLTVAFVGRMARQKAPEVFVEMARLLRDSGGDYRFILHGEGELGRWVDTLIARAGLGDVVERRTAARPVADTLDEAHVLAVTSHNEGLTLTTLEAITHGVPVVSTDVGAQSDIIPSRALVSPNAYRAAAQASRIIRDLAADETARVSLWEEEREAEKRLLQSQSATEWFAQEVRTW